MEGGQKVERGIIGRWHWGGREGGLTFPDDPAPKLNALHDGPSAVRSQWATPNRPNLIVKGGREKRREGGRGRNKKLNCLLSAQLEMVIASHLPLASRSELVEVHGNLGRKS